MVTTGDFPPVNRVEWEAAVRIIRSAYPPIDLFEDIADPADWPLILSAEQKTNPRIMATIGNIDLVPSERRIGGAGASYLMASFTHVSPDRPSRFSDGSYGVLYIARGFETALFETIHHHARFMARTAERAGWTSQFREIVLRVDASLHDLRGDGQEFASSLDPKNYEIAQQMATKLRRSGSDGLAYPSVRQAGGECVALFYPDCASKPVQGRHLDYHWDGRRVDLVRDAGSGAVFRVIEDS
ncbi:MULTISPECIES: RES family NAD+ phosphorylase [Sphingobium]|uniref:RES family NAD+ phosphorylase n=1 Tax=Sphingobium TaxID=165695 RepID=UPI0010202338|nr:MULTISPECIES: RES family NAD+ phosphorylase [Sphingobium]RYM00898.1 RES domain-containing protein [Sphingobium fuliginis]WDA39047.1 RES family NAD+ phosphorylase [Sphingobium sp. YC-XJ3]